MSEPHKRTYKHPKFKASYRVENWSEYEKSLRAWVILPSGFARKPLKHGRPQRMESEAAGSD